MRKRLLALAALSAAAATTIVHGEPLKRIQSHQAGKGVPRIEVISWACDWPGRSRVTIQGEVKNISGTALRDTKPYVVVRNRDKRSVAQSNKKTLDIRLLAPNQRSTFKATLRITDHAAVPFACDLDFTDAGTTFQFWRAGHVGEAEEAGYIGTAKMRRDKSIELRLYSTSNGTDAHLIQVLHRGDKRYGEVLGHVGGLKTGETKLVPPWPEDVKAGGAAQ